MEKYFPTVKINSELFVDLNVFISFIKSNHRPTDKKTEIKTFNLTRLLKGYKDGIKEIQDKKYVPVKSVLRYIFYHVEDLQVCDAISETIICKVFDKKVQERSVLDLYKSISQNEVLFPFTLDFIPSHVEEKIEGIFAEYKSNFSAAEWAKIVTFEWHFMKHAKAEKLSCFDTYENTVSERYNFYNLLHTSFSIGQATFSQSKEIVRDRMCRLSAITTASNIVRAKQKHNPEMLDSDLSYTSEVFEHVNDVVCVDTEKSSNENSIQVYVEVSDEESQSIDKLGIVRRICYTLANKHRLNCDSVVFFKPLTFTNYSANEKIARYLLRDDLLCQKLGEQVLDFHTVDKSSLLVSQSEESNDKCHICFSKEISTPLSMSNFNPVIEWIFDVPLLFQVQLNQCLSSKCVKKSKDKAGFLKTKAEKLYFIYESLLKLSNKNFIGLLQQHNTQKLIMGYKSVSTVFDVTSKSGVSLSLTAAEKQLKEQAHENDSYFNCYLKEYDLEYETKEGNITKPVRMRDCHVILMMDNLVRLKFTDDPKPGECRTKQLNTLPITLQGLPKDCTEVKTWHDLNICDHSAICTCMKGRTLTPKDVGPSIFILTNDEKDVLVKFQKLCTWGCPTFWNKVFESESWPKLLELQENASITVQSTSETTSSGTTCDQDVHSFDPADDADDHNDSVFELLEQITGHEDSTDMECDIKNDSFDDLSAIPDAEFMEKSFQELGLVDQSDEKTSHEETPIQQENYVVPTSFGLCKHILPPLLTRHPQPFAGRDDDITKLKEVLDDVLTKLGHHDLATTDKEKILFGPDHKIGNNLVKLRKGCQKYEIFVPEFPCLHYRKSKINNIFSAYKHAGLLEILQYMRDDHCNEWAKLITAEHIDVATKFVRRLSHCFHLAFLVAFMCHLEQSESTKLISALQSGRGNTTADEWHDSFTEFLKYGCNENATFALHKNMMDHLDHVLSISLAERLGGRDGYNLLLATTKQHIAFGFLNGASSYAPFCLELLHAHSQLGPFYQNMKKSLFSTPMKSGVVNFATDTKRELEHQDAMKGFRTGSTMVSVMRRLALIDSLTESSPQSRQSGPDNLGWTINDTDIKHIIRGSSLILRKGGVTTEPGLYPHNVYLPKKTILPQAILDKLSEEVGVYKIYKYLQKEELFGVTKSDIPDLNSIECPKDLLLKAKQSKGITMRRVCAKKISVMQKTERQCKEEKRVKVVAAQTKKIDCLSSDMNMCQALVKPDCTKPKVTKATGMVTALTDLILNFPDQKSSEKLDQLGEFLLTGTTAIPPCLASSINFVTIEFAGVKFKAKAISGLQYLKQVENGLIKNMIHQLPNVKRMVICEEKYSFTPDDFKAATREQRTKQRHAITHLKTSSEILNSEKFHKDALLTTTEGKSLISKYLASNVSKLMIKKDMILDVDSELNMTSCHCVNSQSCSCDIYSTPIRAFFNQQKSFVDIQKLTSIRQKKGEAEMSQFDWLIGSVSEFKEGENVASIVTSGDIDSVVIHLFGVSRLWPRNSDGSFKNDVYVILFKPGKTMDVYNITRILSCLESRYDDSHIGMKIALTLCLGGNDFIPKLNMISHTKIMKTVVTKCNFMQDLFTIIEGQMSVNKDTYLILTKYLYCSKKFNPDDLTYEEVQRNSMRKGRKVAGDIETGSLEVTRQCSNPQLWMPPASAMVKVADLVDLQIKYLMTAGKHDAPLPNFMSSGCLRKTSTGEVEYDLGPDVFAKCPLNNIQKQSPIKEAAKKRRAMDTPQKGQRKKFPLTSTPVKDRNF